MKLNEILVTKYPDANFRDDIVLHDDGDGVVYIAQWNISDPEPTKEQLDLWAQELELENEQRMARMARAAKYPTWQEQMDMQYHDKINNTNTWVEAIKEVKQSYPIPGKLEITPIGDTIKGGK